MNGRYGSVPVVVSVISYRLSFCAAALIGFRVTARFGSLVAVWAVRGYSSAGLSLLVAGSHGVALLEGSHPPGPQVVLHQ